MLNVKEKGKNIFIFLYSKTTNENCLCDRYNLQNQLEAIMAFLLLRVLLLLDLDLENYICQIFAPSSSKQKNYVIIDELPR